MAGAHPSPTEVPDVEELRQTLPITSAVQDRLSGHLLFHAGTFQQPRVSIEGPVRIPCSAAGLASLLYRAVQLLKEDTMACYKIYIVFSNYKTVIGFGKPSNVYRSGNLTFPINSRHPNESLRG